MLVIVESATGMLVTVRGRKDIHEQNVKAIDDWQKLANLNKEKEFQKQQEDVQLEVLRQKLIQKRDEMMSAGGMGTTPVVGANLNV